MIAGQSVVASDKDEAVVAVDVALVHFGEPDVILDPLVGNDSTDEEEVDQSVREYFLERGAPRRTRDPLGVHRDRENAGPLETQILQFLPIEFGVAQCKIHAADQRRQLAAAEGGKAKQVRVVRCEEVRRGDVVDCRIRTPRRPAKISVIGDGSAK